MAVVVDPVKAAVAKFPAKHQDEIASRKRGVRILTIDGGGTRGILTCQYIKALEAHLGCRLYEYFDYMCGTSTGGILCFALGALRMSAEECEKMYLEFSSRVFAASAAQKAKNFISQSGTVGRTDELIFVLRDIVDAAGLDSFDYPKVACVASNGTTEKVSPFLFANYPIHSRDPALPGTQFATIAQALRATSAAPHYLKPFEFGGMVLQDGGLYANNPTMIALHEVDRLWMNVPKDVIVSLGTGKVKQHRSVVNRALVSPASDVVSKGLLEATDTEKGHEHVQTYVRGRDRPIVYVRLQSELEDDVPLDEVNHARLDLLRAKGEQDATTFLTDIQRIPKPTV